MRSPSEAMGEGKVTVTGGDSTPPPSANDTLDGRLTPSPQNSPSITTRRTMGRSQLSIQELQELAEKQRKQILYSSKELMDKQQLLMKMHNDFRTRLKIQNGIDPATKSPRPNHPNESRQVPATAALEKPSTSITGTTTPSPRTSPRPAKSSEKREQDQYAKMLRETYNNMGKLQNRGKILKEVDIKKLSNVELAHELKKVRAIFSLKQNELAEAVKKVDVLTQELEKRKHGDSGSASMPTPERINRRKKIQAAKDELDRLRNELIVRNEMNTQQSQQLQLQRDIIHEKQQELRELNSRINELGSALLKQHAASSGGRPPPQYPAMNGYQQRLFTGSYLYDTLNRKRAANTGGVAPKQPSIQNIKCDNSSDSNKLIDSQLNDPHSKSPKVELNTKLPPTQRPIYVDPPPTTGGVSLNIKTDLPMKASPSQVSPASSVSSHSSASSATHDEYTRVIKTLSTKAVPPPPPRTVTIGNKTDSYENQVPAHSTAVEKQKSSSKVVPVAPIKPYSDSTLSSDSDRLSWKYDQRNLDSGSGSLPQQTDDVKKKPPPPPVKPKPSSLNPPLIDVPVEEIESRIDFNTTHEIGNRIETSMSRDEVSPAPSSSLSLVSEDKTWDTAHTEEKKYAECHQVTSGAGNVPSEPEEFELSFADIDEINEIQTDIWSNSDSTMSYENDSEEEDYSDFEDISKAVVPVVISISPDKMPPPILQKPEKPRKEKRSVVLDPFILLLDAALEGEMDTVKSILRKVPDPSRPNPEGITALHNAVCGNHKDVVRYLVEVACDINSADNNGWTPLHCAAFYNDTELCQYLVEHGASVFATTYTDYQTPAHKCSRLDENYDVCFGYLHECKENVGRSNGGLVYALYDYVSEHDDEHSFSCGDEFTVLRRGDTLEKEWWWTRNKAGDDGYLPCNLVGNFPRIAAVV